MNKEPRYSLFLFYAELSDDFEIYLFKCLRSGIRVYLFTMDSLENYESTAEWCEAKKTGLFEWHEVYFDSRYADQMNCFIDGKITDPDLFQFLSEHVPSFNKNQYEVIHDLSEHHLLLRAGAGTGKTTTMIERLLFLRHSESLSTLNEATLITFTNEAARTIRERLLIRLNDYFGYTGDTHYLKWMEEAESMAISTIHRFANDLIAPVAHLLGYKNKLTIRSCKYERKQLCEQWIDRFAKEHAELYDPFKNVPQYELIRIVDQVSQTVKNKSLTLKEIQQMSFGLDDTPFSRFLRYIVVNSEQELTEKKKENGWMEIHDLISELASIKEQINLANYIQSMKFLMIDEFQDTDEAQTDFVAWLASKLHTLLFVVGDAKQSIYRFRGANYTAFIQLQDKLNQASEPYQEFTLVKNYRSTKDLLDKYDSMFHEWANQVNCFHYDALDRLVPAREDESEGIVNVSLDDANLKNILSRLENKSGTAVLVRTNHDVDAMIERIEATGNYCEGIRKGDFYRQLPVKEFYLLIKALMNPKDWTVRYALHMSAYGSASLKINDMIQTFSNQRDYIKELIEQQPDVTDFHQLVTQINEFPLMPLLRAYIKKRNPAEQRRKRFYHNMRTHFCEDNPLHQQEEAYARYREYNLNLEQLMLLINDRFTDKGVTLFSLEQFMRINMATNQSEMPIVLNDQPQRIKVMTVHQSKGKEFHNVLLPITDHSFFDYHPNQFILRHDLDQWKLGYSVHLHSRSNKPYGIENDHFCNMNSMEKDEAIGEETRLFYVALTRAKDTVFLHAPEHAYTGDTPHNWMQLAGMGGEYPVSSENI